MLLGVLRHETNSQTSLANLHNWVLDPIHMHSIVHHYPCDQSAHDFIADVEREDCAFIPKDFMSILLEFLSKVDIIFYDLLSKLISQARSEDSQVC